jgi:glyoxylase-like metal-dependent hydrolase (beta-lactamase superfamily II)
MRLSLPHHLSQNQASGVQTHQPVAQFEIGSYRNFIYLILDWTSKKAFIVDPHSGLEPVLEALASHHFELSGILLTHTHFDHIAGLPELGELFPKIPIYVHPLDAHRLQNPLHHPIQVNPLPIHSLVDEQIIQAGTLKIRVLHTPGHSAGECCFLLKTHPPYLFTGDTLFIRDCGRTDLETGSNLDLFQSIQKIKTLPPDTVILPGHHYQKECASLLQTELKESPPLQCKTVNELANLP